MLVYRARHSLNSFASMFIYIIFPGDSVTQLESALTVNEGQDVALQCNYTTTSNTPNLFWYRHYPNKAPEYILWTYGRGQPQHADFAKERFSTKLDESRRTVPLNISQVRVTDSVAYCCALSPTEAQISDSGLQKLPRGVLYVLLCYFNKKETIRNINLHLRSDIHGGNVKTGRK
uniref:Ig-like domain-containing protein n=1 Tax=Callorhinchus milii TaxID=7868 RepID=A0A4W3GPX1_CALMI